MISDSWWLMEVASFLGASVLAVVKLARDWPVEGYEMSVWVAEVRLEC